MTVAAAPTVRIDPEFQALIPPLSDDERRQLEENIKADGCRDPLVTWKGVLLDGHNRHEICERLGIPYETAELEFTDHASAKVWIIRNQFGRRNLAPFQRAELAMALEPLIAPKAKANQRESRGRHEKKSICQNCKTAHWPDEGCSKGPQKSANLKRVDTRAEIAAVAGVSHDTIHKAKVIAAKAPEPVKAKLRTGEISINAAYKDVRKAERRETNATKQKDAAAAQPAHKLWTVTKDVAVVKCDALVTDPPYGILDEPWEPAELEKFTREWAGRWNGCGADIALIFFSQRHLFDGRRWFDESLASYQFQQLLVWHYPNNKSPQSRQGFKQTWEPIYLYRRRDSTKQILVDGSEWGDGLNDFDCHVAAVPQSNFNDAEEKQHPAQKPVAVMRWLVAAATRPNDLVCDPFSGSGTTGIAATKLGRRYHGIETNPEYLRMSEGRLALYGR